MNKKGNVRAKLLFCWQLCAFFAILLAVAIAVGFIVIQK